MSVPVRYHCPNCGTVVTVSRPPRLDDRSVTPYPYPDWTYAEPGGETEAADGIRFTCGADPGVDWDSPGCGDSFYLSFVRFADGERVEPDRVPERVTLGEDLPAERPSTPDTGAGA